MDVVLALEHSGSAEKHSRSFARLLYERLSSIASERDPDAAVDIEAVLENDEPVLDTWRVELDSVAASRDFIIQAMRTPTPPRIDGGRRLKWHLALPLRMFRYLIILPSQHYREQPGMVAGAAQFVKSVLSGLFLILSMPFLYLLAALIALIELRIFRYMGTALLTATIIGAIGLLIAIGAGEAAFVEVVKGLQSFSASVTEQLDQPTIPEASLFQVVAAAATSAFIAGVFTVISLIKRMISVFTDLERDESDRSDLTRLLSPTHGAEYEAALRLKLSRIEAEFSPSRIYILATGTNVILTYRSLARICGDSINTPVTLLSWKATMTEGVTYGIDKLWLLLDRHDWSRFTVKSAAKVRWVHLGATWNLLDNFKGSFRDPDGNVLCEFQPQPISASKALFFANRSTAAGVLANVALDEAYREEVRAAAR